jgi:hypothetical protein
MKLPKSWKEIRVDQFIELKSLKEEDFGSLFLYNLEVIAIVTDTDSDELDDLSPDEVVDMVSSLSWMRKEPPKKLTKKINEREFKPFDILNLGEFIDLEYYFSNDYVNNLTNVAALCYRIKREDEWGNEYFEPYKFNPMDRAGHYEELPITDLYGLIPEYLSFREGIMKAYENLFEPNIEPDEEMDEEDLKEEQEEKARSKWSWESIIYSLCGEDITKADQVTDLPLIMVLNFLSMKTELKI